MLRGSVRSLRIEVRERVEAGPINCSEGDLELFGGGAFAGAKRVDEGGGVTGPGFVSHRGHPRSWGPPAEDRSGRSSGRLRAHSRIRVRAGPSPVLDPPGER